MADNPDDTRDKTKNEADGDCAGGFADAFARYAEINPWAALTADSVAAMEGFAKLMAETASRSHGALSAAANHHKEPGDPDPFKIGPDIAKVMAHLAADPGALANAQLKLWQGYMDLWTSTAQRMADLEAEPAVAPAKGDRRWKDEEWSNNPMFDLIKQSYLLSSNWLVDTLSQVEGVDDETRRAVHFFTRQLADAFSPTNFPLTNPQVLRAAVETRGENFLRGMRNLAEDIERGRGRLSIRQTDMSLFEVGRDVAATPGHVIFQNDILQLIQYTPTKTKQYEIPLLIFPPWINKFYILDLRPENSMVRWLLDQGYPVYLVSWVNPGPELAGKTFEDYMREGIFGALEKTLEQSGAPQANVVGYCIGGTLLSATLAYMKKKRDERIRSATFFAAQADFAEAGELLMFTTDEWMEEIERRMDANGGVLDGSTMADVFNMLRANDLIWSFFVNNYLLGQDPRPFDLLYWNADQTNLAKAVHLFYLDRFYRKNELARGEMAIGGVGLDLSKVDIPTYFQASREDHIAPYNSVYRTAKLFGGDVRYVMAGSGHIAGVVNPPAAQKYQHWTNPASPLPDTVEEWLQGAAENKGSWWPNWDVWLSAKSGDKVAAKSAEDGPLEPIEPAPGSYVKVSHLH